MSPREPGLFLVHELEDDRELLERVRSLHDLSAGRLVLEASPDARNLHWLALDVHRGLGKQSEYGGSPRNAQRLWDWVCAWTAAEHVQDIIVLRAHNLNLRHWNSLMDLAVLAGARLWLVMQGVSLRRTQKDFVNNDWPFTWLSQAAFREAWAAELDRPAGVPAVQETDLPALPKDDFTTFRATCRATLAPRAFERVDQLLCERRAEADAWIAGRPAGSPIGEAELAAFVRHGMRSCTSTREMHVQLRATQTSFFHAGWLLRVNLKRLSTGISDEQQRGLDERAAGLLRGYASGHHAALGAVALITGAQAPELYDLNLHDVAEDGSAVTLGGRRVAVPEHGQALLRAHLASRAMDIDHHAEPALFLQEVDRKGEARSRGRAGHRTLARGLAQISEDTGLPLSAHWNPMTVDDPRSWTKRLGVSAVAL